MTELDVLVDFGCNGYTNNANETWTISTSFSQVVILLYAPIEIDGAGDDFITFFDGPDSTSSDFAVVGNGERYGYYWYSFFNGGSNPFEQQIIAPGGEVTIEFNSNSNFAYDGFLARFCELGNCPCDSCNVTETCVNHECVASSPSVSTSSSTSPSVSLSSSTSLSVSSSPSSPPSPSVSPSISPSPSTPPSAIVTEEQYRFCDGFEISRMDDRDRCTTVFGCDGYGDNALEHWVITVSSGFVSINISAPLGIDGGSYDVIRLYDGTTTSDPLITTIGDGERYPNNGWWYQNTTSPAGQVVNSTGTSILMVFDSDGSITYSGFTATFNCEGFIPSVTPSVSPSLTASISHTASSSISISSSPSPSISISPSSSIASASGSISMSMTPPPSVTSAPSISATPTIISANNDEVVPGIFDFDIFAGLYGHYYNTPGSRPYSPDVEIIVNAIQNQRDGPDPAFDGIVSAMMEVITVGEVNPRVRVNVCPQINPVAYQGPLLDLCLGWYSNELSSWVCQSEITSDGTFYCGLSFMIGDFAVVEKRITSVIAPEVVNVPVNIPVPVPNPVPVLVPTHVDIPIPLPVPHPVDVPNPIPVPVPYPQLVPVDVPVPVIVNVPVDNPVIMNVPNPIPVPQNVPFPNPVPVPVPVPVEIPVYVVVEVPESLSPVSVPSLSPVTVPSVPSVPSVSASDDDDNSPSSDNSPSDNDDDSSASALTASIVVIFVLSILF